MSPRFSSKTVTHDQLTKIGEEMNRISKTLKNKPHVKVGILEKDFDLEAEGGSGTEPRTVGTKAVDNEWGTERIPERSFMRSTFDENRQRWQEATDKLRKAVVAGKIKLKHALGILGEMMEGAIKDKIASHVPPPNAPSTIERKGSSTTLIDTGQMRTSIHHEVNNAD